MKYGRTKRTVVLTAARTGPLSTFAGDVAAHVDAAADEGVTVQFANGNGDEAEMAIARSARAWLHVFGYAEQMLGDKRVAADPAAHEFARVIREMARGVAALFPQDARDVFALIDTLLPMGAMGARSRAQKAAAGAATAKLGEADRARMVRQYLNLCRDGERYGAIKKLSRDFKVSPTVVHDVLKPHKPKRSRK